MGVYSELFDLTGRTVFLSGATGHLGSQVARGLASGGARIIVNSRSAEKCERLCSELADDGFDALAAPFDVAQQAECEAFFAQGSGELEIDCLVNNAYSGGAGTIETARDADYRASYDVSLVGAANLLTAALPALRRAVAARGEASVVNVASMYGIVAPDLSVYDNPNMANPPFYGAAKAALIQWSRYAACEFGGEGIRVNAVSPGPFPSPTVQEDNPDFVEKLAGKVPLGRVGRAEEVVGLFAFLASGASSYVNGANLVIDGGWTAW